MLAAELRRAVAEVCGAVDYSYRRPSRRSAVAGPVVLPALRRPVPEVAVVCDTSGSMTEDLLAMVLAEVEGLLRALGLARQVRVLACDTAVAPGQRVSSARQVQLIGGGGTDMGAGIAAAAALRPRPAVTVVLTDGYTPWPAPPAEGHARRGRVARRPRAGGAIVVAVRPGRTGLRNLGPVTLAGAERWLPSGGLPTRTIVTRIGGRRPHRQAEHRGRFARLGACVTRSCPTTARSPVDAGVAAATGGRRCPRSPPASPGSAGGTWAASLPGPRRGGAGRPSSSCGRVRHRLGDHRHPAGRVGSVRPARGDGGGDGHAVVVGQ